MLLLVGLYLFTSAIVRGEILNFTFHGTITFLDNSGFLLDDSVSAGAPFEGFYIFDSTVADSNSDITIGNYRDTNAITGIVVKVGKYVFRTDPQHVDFLIATGNHPSSDSFVVLSYNNVCSQPLLVELIAWQLDDSSGAALTNDALPVASTVRGLSVVEQPAKNIAAASTPQRRSFIEVFPFLVLK